MAPPRAPYVTDSVKVGLMAPRLWNRQARRMKRQGLPNAAIAEAVGVSGSIIGHFFSPDSLRKHRAKRKVEHEELKREPVAYKHEMMRVRLSRARRLALDPEGTRAREAAKAKAYRERIKADPEALEHYREVRAASARWRRKKRQMIEANRRYRGVQAEQHAGA